MGRVLTAHTLNPSDRAILERIEAILHNPVWHTEFLHAGRLSVQRTGHVPVGPLWGYLERRRDLDPRRFDHYHPALGRIFRSEHAMPTTPVVPVVPVVTPVSTVAEPSSLILSLTAMFLIASIIAARFVAWCCLKDFSQGSHR